MANVQATKKSLRTYRNSSRKSNKKGNWKGPSTITTSTLAVGTTLVYNLYKLYPIALKHLLGTLVVLLLVMGIMLQ
jgi:hypothetical protein